MPLRSAVARIGGAADCRVNDGPAAAAGGVDHDAIHFLLRGERAMAADLADLAAETIEFQRLATWAPIGLRGDLNPGLLGAPITPSAVRDGVVGGEPDELVVLLARLRLRSVALSASA